MGFTKRAEQRPGNLKLVPKEDSDAQETPWGDATRIFKKKGTHKNKKAHKCANTSSILNFWGSKCKKNAKKSVIFAILGTP